MWQLLIPAITSIIDKVIPDPTEAANAKLRAMEMAQNGELKQLEADVELAKGQMAINQVEASQDNFRGGWRPGAAWVCVFGLFYQFLLQPLLPWILTVAGLSAPPLPAIDSEALLILLFSLLGLGGYRSLERIKGKV